MPALKPRWLKVFTDLWLHKGRTALMVLSISVGVFTVGMVTHSYLYLICSSDEGYISINPTSGFLVVDQLDDNQLDVVRRLPEVAEVEGRRIETARINLGGEWYKLQLSGLNFEQTCINLLESTAGAAIPQDRQLLIDQTALYLTRFEVGDTAVVEMADGRRYEMPVVGRVRDLMANPSANSGRINTYLTLDTFGWMGQPAEYNRLFFTTTAARSDFTHVQQVTRLVKEELRESGSQVLGSFVFPKPGEYLGSVVIEAIVTLLGLMAIVSLGLGAFLVFNTISALMAAQNRQIGVMRVIGASRRDLLLMYLALALVYGLSAFVIAIVPAAWAANRFSEYLAGPQLLDLRLMPFQIPPVVIASELAVSILVPILGAWPAVNATVRSPAHQAICTHGLSDNFGNHLLDRSLGHVRSVASSWLLCVGAVMRSKKRTLLTVATLVLGGAFFGGVTSLKASTDKTIASLADTYRHDVEVSLAHNYRAERVLRSAASIPGVESAEGWSMFAGALVLDSGAEGNGVRIIGLPARTKLVRPKIVSGRWLKPEDENGLVVDSSLLRQYPDLSAGDTLRLSINGRHHSWTIVGIYQHVGIHFGYFAFTNKVYLSRLTKEVGCIRQVQLVTTQHDPAFQAHVAGRVDETLKAHGLHVSTIETASAQRRVLARELDIIVAVLMVMALLLTLTSSLGLLSTMSISVLERSREIGVLRVLGATHVDVVRIVIGEGLFLVVVSWFAAVVLAWPVGVLLAHVIGQQLLASPMSYVYSFSGMLIWLAIALASAAAAGYGPARHASRLTIRNLLTYE